MRYVEIQGVEKPVSKIFFGTATEPFLSGGDGNEILDAVFELGVNAFDCARKYQGAEESLGRWIQSRDNREKVVLLTKCAHPGLFGRKRVNERAIRRDFRISSGKLGTDYFDIYLLHRDDPQVDVGEIVEIMNGLFAEGKIKTFGGSNWTHQRIEAANEYAYAHGLEPFRVSSPNFGLAEQVTDLWGGGCVSISGENNLEARRWYEANQMPVIAYSSLARGFFSGRLKSSSPEKASEVLDSFGVKGYVSEGNFERLRRCEEVASLRKVSVPKIAMAFVYNHPMNTFAVVSTKRPARMQENVEAVEIRLTPEEIEYLDLRIDHLPDRGKRAEGKKKTGKKKQAGGKKA